MIYPLKLFWGSSEFQNFSPDYPPIAFFCHPHTLIFSFYRLQLGQIQKKSI